MYKMNLEMLADGSPVMVTVFLDKGINAEEFGAKVQIKRGEIMAVAVNKLEMKKQGSSCIMRPDKLHCPRQIGSGPASQLIPRRMVDG